MQVGDSVIYQQVRDEIVLLHMEEQRYYGLDPVGTEMWKLLMKHSDADAIIEELSRTYNVDEATLRRDLDALTRELISKGLLKGGNCK